tara:strand:- start:5134 stop:6294 length:1161 start_codon:yes stop_codon:yes gene_type:complete
MANTLTNLTPDLYAALDRVSRELVGLVPSVSRDSSAERAAKDQTVRSFVAPASTASDITPGQLPADNGDQSIGNKTISISKSRYVPVRWNGEEQRGMNTGPGYNMILQDQFAQAIRTLVNEMEVDLAGEYAKASVGVESAGTTLFDAANYKDLANVAKELNINGAPMENRSVVLSNAAAAAFRGNATYTSANSAGEVAMLRQGVLLDQFGMMIRESNQIQNATAGTASSATSDNAGYSIGDTVITLASAGTGTILAGDIISFAGDASGAEYVVESGDADVSGGGTITLAAPGLRGALAASTQAITVVATGERNMAFSQNAIHLVTRAPARPLEGDSAEDVMIVQDPRSGLAFEIAMYKEYRQVKFEVAAAWGFEVIKPEHLVLLYN